MPGVDDLAPEWFAALVAPAVDRVHRGVHDRSAGHAGAQRLRRHGVPHPGLLITLRFVLLRGPMDRAAFPLALRYDPPGDVLRAVDELVAGGWLMPASGELPAGCLPTGGNLTADGELPADGALGADGRTAAFLHDVYDLHAEVTAAAWPRDLSALLDAAGTLLAAGTATGGPAFAAFAPPHERAGDPPGVLLFNRLAALRYHRSNAHAAAWAARGLTAAEIAALPADAPLRREIEADTNGRAATPYEALTPAERLAFLAGLAALP